MWVCTCTYVYIIVFCTRLCVFIYVYMYIWVCIYVYLSMPVCVCVCVCAIDNCRTSCWKILSSNRNLTTTANELVFYSTYYPRSSVHFLAPCSKCCKPLKLIHACVCPHNYFSTAAVTFTSDKNDDHLFSFSVDGSSGIQSGSDLESWVGGQDIGRPLIPVSSGLYVLREQEHYRVSSWTPRWNSRVVFPSRYPSNAPAEMSNIPLS